ncbi:MAG: hypothetical protein MUC68_05375 [Burkholderiaceae bacterium]|nr:hypothetical protein [Burkholderiaceae bacterium]
MPAHRSDADPAVISRPTTRWVAAALLLWLSLLALGTGFASAVLLSAAEDYAESTAFQIVLCMTGGALGASLTALLAAGERIARGWSFAPDALARGERRFNARLAPLLAVQPILGAALGMVLLLVLSSGSVVLLRLTEGTTFDPMGLLLVAVIAGLFARTLLARVRDSVEALFGRATQGAEPYPVADAMRGGRDPLAAVTVAPAALRAPPPMPTAPVAEPAPVASAPASAPSPAVATVAAPPPA